MFHTHKKNGKRWEGREIKPEEEYTGVYKVLYTMIVFPINIFLNLYFLPRNIRPPPRFPT